MKATVAWADSHDLRWAFTLSNAGAYYFKDRGSLSQMNEIDWDSVAATRWSGNGIPSSVKEGKQAEFLVERLFPWSLVERIGVYSEEIAVRAINAMQGVSHRPTVEILKDWYY